MVKTAYASKPWAYIISKNHGWERVVSPFNDFMTYASEFGSFCFVSWFVRYDHLKLHMFVHIVAALILNFEQIPHTLQEVSKGLLYLI